MKEKLTVNYQDDDEKDVNYCIAFFLPLFQHLFSGGL